MDGRVPRTATGTFAVTLEPQGPDAQFDDPLLGRMSIDKRFSGDLDAQSRGQMLSARSSQAGSAGYVAIEKVSGTLHGRSGSFVLQHSSTMDRGTPHQSISVVPGSGTGQLEGLIGSMAIKSAADGGHAYEFDYTLP